MYEQEFDTIWDKQREFYPNILTDKLKYGTEGKQEYPIKPRDRAFAEDVLSQFGLHGIIFFQRKMYWPKSVVGECELTDESDPDRKCKRRRCARADRAAQSFRILQEVNNLRVLEGVSGQRRLTDQERQTVTDALFNTKQQTFDALRKKLDFTDDITFNTERGGRGKLKGHETDAALCGF